MDTEDRSDADAGSDQPAVERDQPAADEAATDDLADEAGTKGEQRAKLLRSDDDKMLGGVCAAIAGSLHVPTMVVRGLAVATASYSFFIIAAYVIATVLIPIDRPKEEVEQEEGFAQRASGLLGIEGSEKKKGSVEKVAHFSFNLNRVLLAGALVIAAAILAPWGWINFNADGTEPLLPFGALAVYGAGVWSVSSSQRWVTEVSGWDSVGASALSAASVVLACITTLVGAFGGSSSMPALAAIVIGMGIALVIGALVGPIRWLIGPALAIALPLGLLSALNTEVDSSAGRQVHRPVHASQLPDRYELGAGTLVLDLSSMAFNDGVQRVAVKVGVGSAVVLVPRGLCVSSNADVGIGRAAVLGETSSGIDVHWRDRRAAPSGGATLALDAEIGVGNLKVVEIPFATVIAVGVPDAACVRGVDA